MKGHTAAGVVLLRGGLSACRDDTDHELLFRQESWFHWCFGVREPDWLGAIDLASGEELPVGTAVDTPFGRGSVLSTRIGSAQRALARKSRGRARSGASSSESDSALQEGAVTTVTMYSVELDWGTAFLSAKSVRIPEDHDDDDFQPDEADPTIEDDEGVYDAPLFSSAPAGKKGAGPVSLVWPSTKAKVGKGKTQGRTFFSTGAA